MHAVQKRLTPAVYDFIINVLQPAEEEQGQSAIAPGRLKKEERTIPDIIFQVGSLMSCPCVFEAWHHGGSCAELACEHPAFWLQVEELEKHLIQISRYGALPSPSTGLDAGFQNTNAFLHGRCSCSMPGAHHPVPSVQATTTSCGLPSAAQIAISGCCQTGMYNQSGKTRYA